MRKAVFFDLDGTLLPLDMEAFLHTYYSQISKSGFYELLGENGHHAFEKAIYAMLANDGCALNRDVFFGALREMTNADMQTIEAHMDAFYADSFNAVKHCTHTEPDAVDTVRLLLQKGYRLILATNPLFPSAATDARIKWAGLNKSDFEYISYYDNSHYCKPNLAYFKEILSATGLGAHQCYFVGNDVREDMVCLELGFQGFLVTNHLIGDPKEVPQCAQGDYSVLRSFAENLPQI